MNPELVTVSLEEMMWDHRNFFPGEHWSCTKHPIQSGSIQLPGLEVGDYYMIEGSKRNNGLHIHGESDLVGETLTGCVTECRIPKDFIKWNEQVNVWFKEEYPKIYSVFESESYGGYAYKLKAEDKRVYMQVFADQSRRWRKI